MAADATAAPAAQAAPAVSFADVSSGPDAAMVALDAALAEGAPGGDATPAGDGAPAPAAAAPAAATEATDAKPSDAAPNDVDGARLRRGYSKLEADRQKVIELQNQARSQIAQAEQWKADAEAFKAFREDPGAFVLSQLKPDQVNKLLDRIAAEERSPEARRLDEIEARQERERTEATQAAQVRKVEEWKAGIVKGITEAGEKYDLVNALGLHGDVIDVITKYYEKNSERDDKGNVTKPAILPWETAAEAVENTRAERIEKASKKFGKRAPAAPAATPVVVKDATSDGKPPAPKRTGTTSLSSVPVAEAPVAASQLSADPVERERQILAELGL